MNRDLAGVRKDFSKHKLSKKDLDENPINQFKIWLTEAIDSGVSEPTAFTLSTVAPGGIPSVRILLLKKLEEQTGFWFYTNYQSKKGRELEANNNAAMNFFWPDLERQVRIIGKVTKTSSQDSDNYFNSRPLESRYSAIASPQSQIVKNRKKLVALFEEAKEKEIKRPEHWGGYMLQPAEIEFWQGRSGRLHDRILYRQEGHEWIKERLAP